MTTITDILATLDAAEHAWQRAKTGEQYAQLQREYHAVLEHYYPALRVEIERLKSELISAEKWNHAVSVCANHASDIVTYDGCVICDLLSLKSELHEMREREMTEEKARAILGKETILTLPHKGLSYHSVGVMITERGAEFYMPFKLDADQLRALSFMMDKRSEMWRRG